MNDDRNDETQAAQVETAEVADVDLEKVAGGAHMRINDDGDFYARADTSKI